MHTTAPCTAHPPQNLDHPSPQKTLIQRSCFTIINTGIQRNAEFKSLGIRKIKLYRPPENSKTPFLKEFSSSTDRLSSPSKRSKTP
jgi:hypothetical protein